MTDRWDLGVKHLPYEYEYEYDQQPAPYCTVLLHGTTQQIVALLMLAVSPSRDDDGPRSRALK